MKKLLAVLLLVAPGFVYADFSSTWTLQRVIITDKHSAFDSALDASITVEGHMQIVNDSYTVKGKMCDTRTQQCIWIKEQLQILALDKNGFWADTVDQYGHESTVHIINREKDSTDSLNLMFTETDLGMTLTQSFALVDHEEELPVFEFENGVGMLEGKMMLDQLRRNHKH